MTVSAWLELDKGVLNDPEGLWKVKIRDVESGVEREAVFKVENSK